MVRFMRSDSHSGMSDERGQWFIISGFLIAIILVSLTVFLNEISLSGAKISYTPYYLPYYDMRSLTVEMTRAYKNGDLDNKSFENITKIYALHGYCVDVKLKRFYSFGKIEGKYLCINFSTEYLNLEVNKSVVRYK